MPKKKGLTEAQRRELSSYLKNPKRTAREVRRSQSILLYDDGVSQETIFGLTGYKRTQVFEWKKRYLSEDGINGIKDKRKGEPKKLLSKSQREELLQLLSTTSPKRHDYENTYWTTGILADFVERKYNVKYKSKTSYYVLFKESKLSFHKPGQVYEKNDPQKVETWRKETQPKLEAAFAEKDTVVLVEDEMVLSSQTTFQKVWLPKGEYPKIEVSNTKTNRSIYGFLNIKNGKGHAYKTERQNMFITVECLKQIRHTYPKVKILILWDGAGWHRGSEVQNFIKDDKNIETIYFPPYSPEENPQEHVWKNTRSNVTHNRFIDNIDKVADEFVNYISSNVFKYKLLNISPL